MRDYCRHYPSAACIFHQPLVSEPDGSHQPAYHCSRQPISTGRNRCRRRIAADRIITPTGCYICRHAANITQQGVRQWTTCVNFAAGTQCGQPKRFESNSCCIWEAELVGIIKHKLTLFLIHRKTTKAHISSLSDLNTRQRV